MADRSPVDTAELRRLQSEAASHRGWIDTAGAFTVSAHAALRLVNALPALLDEIDALRAKLAESEAACTVLARVVKFWNEFVREQGRVPDVGWPASWAPDYGDGTGTLFEQTDKAIASLSASVLSHIEEDAALREVAKVLATRHWSGGPKVSLDRDEVERVLVILDAVCAKGGG